MVEYAPVNFQSGSAKKLKKRTPKKKSSKKSTPKKSGSGFTRHWKIVEIDGKAMDMGRYGGHSPGQAANKAFTSICSEYSKKAKCNHTFSIQETTQGSDKKIKTYVGESFGKKKVPLGGKMISVTDRRVRVQSSLK
jgi:hypothetical protein